MQSSFFEGYRFMNLLLQAAYAWAQLTCAEYRITVGRKGHTSCFQLCFSPEDFPHLCGMQYARDVDFGLRRNEFEGNKLLASLLSGKLDGARLEKSQNWEKIKGRLNAIIRLKQTLESDFVIARFDSKRVLTGSKIQAEYVIQNTTTGEIFFIFLDKDQSQRYYCKSAFAKTNVDYLKNQALVTVLEKEKYIDGTWKLLFRHPNYIREPAEIG